jgi:hypothetical protein
LSSPNPEFKEPEKNSDPSQNPSTRSLEDQIVESPEGVQISVSPELKLAISELKDFLSGSSTAPTILDSMNAEVRQLIAAELLAAIAGSAEPASPSQDQSRSRLEQPDNGELTLRQDHGHQTQERARQLFVDCGYLDEVISSLRVTDSPEERANAARILGVVGSQRGTASLIAALFDDAPEVRIAAEEALGQIGDPSVSIGPISTMISGDIDYGAPYLVETPEAESASIDEAENDPSGEDAIANIHFGAKKFPLKPSPGNDPEAVAEASSELEELDQIRNSIAELECLLVEAVAARKDADKEASVRAEQESAFRAEAAARRREDEEARKRAEEKAARRRSEDDRKMAAEQLGRLQAELEAQRLAEEEERLRVEAASLRQTADELSRQRAESEAREFAVAAEARRLDAENTLRKAEERYNAELKRLRTEEEALQRASEEASSQRIEVETQRRETEEQARMLEEEKRQLAELIATRDTEAQLLRETEAQARRAQEELHQQVEALLRVSEEVASRRSEIEAERASVAAEVEQLKEAQERIGAAEKVRRQAEAERLQLEAELARQVEKEQRLLAEIRRRADGEQRRLEEASRLRAEEQDRHLAELEALRAETEVEAQLRAEKERRLNSEIEYLRAAEREALTRIGVVESLRNRAEETHHLATEKVQRIEAEARRQTMEDQRVLDKLEETRRNLELEAYARVEHERHLKEEIEALRRLEKEERNRIADISNSRAEAEVRLHRERERLKLEQEALARAESQIEFLLEPTHEGREEAEWYDDPVENLRAIGPPAVEEVPGMSAEEFVVSMSEQTSRSSDLSEDLSLKSVRMELTSDDPYKRVAGLAALAHHGGSEAFDLIAGCFDDPAPQVRDAAARALRDREPDRTVESFTRAIEEGSAERTRNIGFAIAASGLAREALYNLSDQSREDTYKALSLLFVMAKTGEIQPLIEAIEKHPEPEVCSAAIKLLNLSGQSDAAEAALQRRREGGS